MRTDVSSAVPGASLEPQSLLPLYLYAAAAVTAALVPPISRDFPVHCTYNFGINNVARARVQLGTYK